MFDLRYHVASLAAVFLALIIGILVGVGISGKGFVSDSERSLFNERIADLKSQLDSATKRGTDLARAQRAAQSFVQDAYPSLMDSRLSGSKVGLVFAGPVDGRVRSLVEETLGDAGGPPPLRVRRSSSRSTCPPCGRRSPTGPRSPRWRRSDASATSAGGSAAISCSAATAPRGRRCRRPSSRSRQATMPRRSTRSSSNRSTTPQVGVTARFLAGFYAGLACPGHPGGRRPR